MTRRFTSCAMCGVPWGSFSKLWRGRCGLCREFLRRGLSEEERKVIGAAVRAVWEMRGIPSWGFAAPGEASGPDVPSDFEDAAPGDLGEDPWLLLLTEWLEKDRPKVVTLEGAIAGMGMSGKMMGSRRRIRALLEHLGRPVMRRRFAAEPAHLFVVRAALAKVPPSEEISIERLVAATGLEATHRTKLLIGRCLTYLGYRRCRTEHRVEDVRHRSNVYRRPSDFERS